MRVNSFILLLLFCFSLPLLSAQGKIIGKLIAGLSQEPVIGANVFLDGFTIGTASDVDGVFVIENVPIGEYTLVVEMIGYAQVRVTEVPVVENEFTRLNEIALRENVIAGEEVVITARLILNNEAALLTQRQKADAISDGLSSEAISRSGAGEAAEAMTQVTGASVVDGKYVYVRGLGDRYASTHLNGVELPSADPDKRSVQLDMIPAGLLDNIVTTKTFTPDKAGNFAGGVVNLGIKTFPEELQVSFSTSASWNSAASLNDGFLTTPGGDISYFGADDGSRAFPSTVSGFDGAIPTEVEARTSGDGAGTLDDISNAFTPVMAPVASRSPLNHGYALSLGNKLMVGNRPLGYFGSLTYSRDYSFYEDGQFQQWKLVGDVSETDSLNNLADYSDTRSSVSVLLGAMGTFSYQLQQGHDLHFNVFHSRSGTSTARYLAGPWPEQNVQGFETRALQYQDRRLTSWQLRGEHKFERFRNIALDWLGSTAETSQDEPDTRFFSNTFSERVVGGIDTTIYSISPSIITRPSRYFRELGEDHRSLKLNAVIPLTGDKETGVQVKVGGSYDEKDRNFTESLYQYWQGTGFKYDGDPQSFFAPGNIGVTGFDSTTNRYTFGNYIQSALGGYGGDYGGAQRINAVYGMFTVPLFKDLNLITGARYEVTRMHVTNGVDLGQLSDNDLLPSVNLTYQLQNDMNLRAAYGRTLARPNFREMAPYASFEFVNGDIFQGNPELQRSLIDNYDLRWEWFRQPGEVFSVSGYYKYFKSPIERVINLAYSSGSALVTYDNVGRAEVLGMEFELRKQLGFIHSSLNSFMIGGNLSVIESKVTIPEEEFRFIQALDPLAKQERELQGQSPYLVNLSLAFQNISAGTNANLQYNVFGERMSEVGRGGAPNVFEQPRHLLNFTFSQRFMQFLHFKLGVKNILNAEYRFIQTYKDVEYVRSQYEIGRSISVGLSYDFN